MIDYYIARLAYVPNKRIIYGLAGCSLAVYSRRVWHTLNMFLIYMVSFLLSSISTRGVMIRSHSSAFDSLQYSMRPSVMV